MVVAYTTSLRPTAHELHRFTYPSVTRKRHLFREINDGTQPAEPPMRISQAVLEPTLKEALEAVPTATIRYGCAIESCEQTDERVTALIRNAEAGELERVECEYLVGCDGGNSTVRKRIGKSTNERAEGLAVAVELCGELRARVAGLYLIPPFRRYDHAAELIELVRSD